MIIFEDWVLRCMFQGGQTHYTEQVGISVITTHLAHVTHYYTSGSPGVVQAGHKLPAILLGHLLMHFTQELS